MEIEFRHCIDDGEEALRSLQAMLNICNTFGVRPQDVHNAVRQAVGSPAGTTGQTPIVAVLNPGERIPVVKKVQFIKLIRAQTGCGLREAKIASESVP